MLFGPGHDCGRLTGHWEVGRGMADSGFVLTNAVAFTDPALSSYSRVTGNWATSAWLLGFAHENEWRPVIGMGIPGIDQIKLGLPQRPGLREFSAAEVSIEPDH